MSNEGKILGLLTPNNLHNIYHLNPVEVKSNKEYLDRFYLSNLKPYEVMKPWYKDENDFKDRAKITKYIPLKFISPVQYLTAMLSVLHGEADYTNFKSEWLPLTHGVLSIGAVFNWESILCHNLLKAMEKDVQKKDP